MTDIVDVPQTLPIAPFPALGSPNYNQEAYENGISVPPAIERLREIAQAGRTNALATHELATFTAENAEAASESAQAAGESKALSADWASKSAGPVDGAEYSAKAHAVGSTPTGSSKDWASKSAGPVDGAEYSAKWYAGQAAQAMERYQGVSATDPATGKSGPLVPGDWYINTNTGFIRAYNGEDWVNGVSALAGVTSINGMQGNVTLSLLGNTAYDDRAALRAMTPADGDVSLVEGLGLFLWRAGSDEPDDDESCFATTSGRWLLECPHADLLAAWSLPDDEIREATASATADIGQVLRATVPCVITTIAAVSQAVFTAAVTGAVVGNAVLITALGAMDARIAASARVTAPGVVTISLNNPSAAAASTIPAVWQVAVFKEI